MHDSALEVAADFDFVGADRLSVAQIYHRALAERNFVADTAQQAAVARLQRMYEEWAEYKQRRRNAVLRMLVKPPLPRGVYMWGGVGRGKSFLMDAFYTAVPLVRKRRVHFHSFMRDVHREMAELRDVEDPLMTVAMRIAHRHRLICFDEFHVNDIADAMILGRLLERTIRRGVAYCMTSNYPPDELYRDGLKRESFLPTIALLNSHLDVLNVDGGVDYRRQALERIGTYHTPLDARAEAALEQAIDQVGEAGATADPDTGEIQIEGRPIACRRVRGGAAWFDCAILCGWGRSQNDYIELARRFHTVLVSDVPRMDLDHADLARRFTLMVDVFYDHRVNLIVSAAAEPERLLDIEGEPADARLRAMRFEFDRTASRLLEMQSAQYRQASQRASARSGRGETPAAA